MEHRPVTPSADLRRDLTVADIRSTIVDVPTVRQHKLSQLAVSAQSYVIVEIRLANGATGVGEAATLGGPRWSEESVEGIKAVIDAHLAPAVLGADASRFEAAAARMDAAAKRNNAAKAAIESALFDAVGRTLGVPAVQLLGGVGARADAGLLDARLRRPDAGDRGGGGEARRAPARPLQDQDRRPAACGRPRPAAPDRGGARGARDADRRREPGLGRGDRGARDAGARRNGRDAGRTAAARPGTSRALRVCAPARRCR